VDTGHGQRPRLAFNGFSALSILEVIVEYANSIGFGQR
jgi:hypothetical protein